MVGLDAAAIVVSLAATLPPALPPTPPAPPRPQASERPARTVGSAIRRAHLAGAVTWSRRRGWEAALAEARAAAGRLPATRAAEIGGALGVADRLAAAGRLGAERLDPVMAGVRATTWAMRTQPLPATRARLQPPRDGLVYEFRRGAGVQVHPLASAGRLNGLADACLHERREARCRPLALDRAADALAGAGVRDGRVLRFEYLFPFAGAPAPWTSSMAQATAAQALARAARVTGRRRHARAATAAFHGLLLPATAARRGGRIAHFSMYSFDPRLRVLNGELQTVVGLAGYARLSGSRRARRIVRRSARRLVLELPVWDTGAWTRYAAGGAEATLHYHGLAQRFAGRACRRAIARAFCAAARDYARYTAEAPRLAIAATAVARAGRVVRLRLRASKRTSGTLDVRGPRLRLRRAVELGRAAVEVRVRLPRAGTYAIDVRGRAVNGRVGRAAATVRVRRRTAAADDRSRP